MIWDLSVCLITHAPCVGFGSLTFLDYSVQFCWLALVGSALRKAALLLDVSENSCTSVSAGFGFLRDITLRQLCQSAHIYIDCITYINYMYGS